MTIKQIKTQMKDQGFTPSHNSWEDSDIIFVFSEELINNKSLNGAAMTMTFRKSTQTLFVQ